MRIFYINEYIDRYVLRNKKKKSRIRMVMNLSKFKQYCSNKYQIKKA